MRRLALLLAMFALAPACARGGGTPPTPPVLTPQACVFPYAPPAGFTAAGSQRVPQGFIVGTRAFYRGPGGAHIVYTAGALMDMAEEVPVARRLPLTNGRKGELFRSSKDRWILFWNQTDDCSQYTVGGDGLTRQGFEDLLRAAGILAPGHSP